MTEHPEIELRAIDVENWQACIALRIAESQASFVSSNLFSLAQSKFETCRVPCAIYNASNEMVGFALYNDQPLPGGSYRISRLMIDEKYQGKGYGVAAATKMIDLLSKVSACDKIFLDHHPNNHQAAALWRNLGFVECGNLGENIQLCLSLGD